MPLTFSLSVIVMSPTNRGEPMSIMEIPDSLYSRLFHLEVARQIDHGLDLIAAREMASSIMGHAFIARGTALARECQLDNDEFIEEMSLGGRPYKVPR